MASLGGKCVFASDIDADCRKTYLDNYGIQPAGDITKVAVEDIPPHDVLCGGFPCQAFSKAGNRLGFEDSTKGTLFFDICRILEYHKPKYVLLENVRNLASHDSGNTWKVIHDKLDSLGYNLLSDPVIFSPHYVGIPQHRERVFIMCIRKDLGEISPFQFKKEDCTPCTIESILQDDSEISNIETFRISPDMENLVDLWNDFIQNLKGAKLPGFPVWAEWLRDIKQDEDLNQYPEWKRNFIIKNNELYVNNREFIDRWLIRAEKNPLFFGSKAKLEWQAGQTDNPNIWNQIFQFRPSGIRVKTNTYFPALVAIVQTSIIGSRRRFLTPRECARLQSFPESFRPDVKMQQAYKQFGNSVNVDIVRLFAMHMFGNDSSLPLIDEEQTTLADTEKCRQSEYNGKLYLASGNAFSPHMYGADGLVAFVNKDHTEMYEQYNSFIERKDKSVAVSLYLYNSLPMFAPQIEEYADIIKHALNLLCKSGVHVIVMPRLQGEGGSESEQLIAQEKAVSDWLDSNSDNGIQRIYILSYEEGRF